MLLLWAERHVSFHYGAPKNWRILFLAWVPPKKSIGSRFMREWFSWEWDHREQEAGLVESGWGRRLGRKSNSI